MGRPMRAMTPLAMTQTERTWLVKLAGCLLECVWCRNLLFVAEPGKAKHDESSEDIRRCDEAVGSSSTEAHTVLKNDGQEIRNGVGDGGGEHEDGGKSPNLEVKAVLQVLLDVELLGERIVAILLDTGDNKVDLSLVEELLAHTRLVGELREVNDEVPADETDDDGDDTLEDKNPAPASQPGAKGDRGRRLSLGGTMVNTKPWGSLNTVTLKKGEEVAENTREGRRQHADEEEDSVTLLELVALIPN
jgi:hypothetical protein